MSSASLGQSAEAKVSPMETSSYTREAPSGEGSDRKVQAKGIARDSERQPVEITTTQRPVFRRYREQKHGCRRLPGVISGDAV